MKTLIRLHLVQIIIIFLILLLFLANVTGLLAVNISTDPIITFRAWKPGTGGDYFIKLIRSTDFLLLFATGTLLTILLPVLSPVRASILAVVSVIPPVLINLAYATRQPLIPMEYSLLTVLILYSINVLIGYFRETHSRQQIIQVFGQYVPPEVVAEINKNPGQINMDGESRRLTVFFCDLQNFTGTAEQLNPKQLAALLNEYLSAMSEILFKHGATIDKYIGDSIMAFWGAPLPQTDHARRAVLSSFEMHGKIQRLSEQFIKKGWPGPKMGIGINTGMMNVGNMGSRFRIAYTVVGDAVNLASRLEGLTRVYRVPTIVSETTMNECTEVLFRELDAVHVKGKHKSYKIYQPLCPAEEVDNVLHRQMADHKLGINYYYQENWREARAVFKQLGMERKDDDYYPAMLGKIEEMLNR
jgi:adenylate cyclase